MSGPIGAGKSSLATLLAEHLGSKAFYEHAENNPVLPLYYQDMSRYTFLLNIYLLNYRLAQINTAMASKNNVLDRSIYEDPLFFKMNVENGVADQTEYQIYNDLLHNMMEPVPGNPNKKPDLLIYIHASLDTMLTRIKKRGRSYEQVDTDPELKEYYRHLQSLYDPWYQAYNQSPKLAIDGDKYDFMVDPAARQKVLQLIDQKLQAIGNL